MKHAVKTLVKTTLVALLLTGCADRDYKEIQGLYKDVQDMEQNSSDPQNLLTENERAQARIESYLAKHSSGEKAENLRSKKDSLARQHETVAADYNEWKSTVGSLSTPSSLSQLKNNITVAQEYMAKQRVPVLVNKTKPLLEEYQKMGPQVVKKEVETIVMNLDGDMEAAAKKKAGTGGCIVPLEVEVSEDQSAREGNSGDTSFFAKRGYYVHAKCLTTEKSDYVTVRATVSADVNALTVDKSIN